MAIKCAVLGLPYGGGKGGIIVDPQKLSRGELERLTRGFIQRIAPIIGELADIPAPDVNTDSRIMGWMVDEYSKIKGVTVSGIVTGKPKILGGSAGRGSATGRGVMLCVREAFKKLRIKPLDATVAVQGFGNVGSFSAKLIHDMKAKIVAVSDVTGGIYNEAGLNPYDVEKYAKENNNSVLGFPGSKTINNQELLALPVTVLVPAALENQINAENVHTIQARIIAEAANGPTTPDADAELVRKGVMIIPDVLANAGGVTVSYFEWVQNLYRYYWSEKEVHARLEEMMVEAFNNVYDTANLHRTDLRIGAYITALGRISEACKMRGWA
jgi:glutamate dehydrogenase/leucine dehydrogenase